jgi:hypothetical protein
MQHKWLYGLLSRYSAREIELLTFNSCVLSNPHILGTVIVHCFSLVSWPRHGTEHGEHS